MNSQVIQWFKQVMGAQHVQSEQRIQSLWSGYGEIVRLTLAGAGVSSVVLKYIRFPTEIHHPHGWHSDFSHQRKVMSYQVETHWYEHFSTQCNTSCRLAVCYGTAMLGDEHVILLEDLDAVGFDVRKTWLNQCEARVCLHWLAHFHAMFLGSDTKELWSTGTYWHLETRPDEWKAMPESTLKQAANIIDERLAASRFKTIIHGDAKVANFCFSRDGSSVAAVDFQYVGGGCGMKDVAYFIGSCLDEQQEVAWENTLLDDYFNALKHACVAYHPALDVTTLEAEWRTLFPVAQADFSRFLAGWRPNHWKVNDHHRRIAAQVSKQLRHHVSNR